MSKVNALDTIAPRDKFIPITHGLLEMIATSLPKVEFNPAWHNGTGYFNGAIKDKKLNKLPQNKVHYTVDENGRMLFIVRYNGEINLIAMRYQPSEKGRHDSVKVIYQGGKDLANFMDVDAEVNFRAALCFFTKFGPAEVVDLLVVFAQNNAHAEKSTRTVKVDPRKPVPASRTELETQVVKADKEIKTAVENLDGVAANAAIAKKVAAQVAIEVMPAPAISTTSTDEEYEDLSDYHGGIEVSSGGFASSLRQLGKAVFR